MVLTGNGEVHTNEEAHVYVHDLNPFVTVQLEETLLFYRLENSAKITLVGGAAFLLFLMVVLGALDELLAKQVSRNLSQWDNALTPDQ